MELLEGRRGVVKGLRSPRINKLSARISVASRAKVRKDLQSLRQLISDGEVIADELQQIMQNLLMPYSSAQQESLLISSSLANNEFALKSMFTNCIDVAFRNFVIGKTQKPAFLIYIDGLVDTELINEHIMQPLMNIRYAPTATASPDVHVGLIKNLFLEASGVEEIETIGKVAETVLTGDTVLLLDGDVKALRIVTKGWESRSVAEPVTESVVRGPREGFTENLRTNTALLRRRIKSPQFRLEKFIIGRMTKTETNLAYLAGTADDKVVEEVRQRIGRIDVDSILESAYIEELIEDTPYSLFPQIEHSERPDKVAAAILEGRVAIFVDGTPFVLIVPTMMVQFWQSSEDYYERYPIAFPMRILRFAFSTIALLLPGIYVAITSFHQELIPTTLLISIEGSRAGVPFPIYVEALMMEIAFEALREAGVRLPRPVGQAVSIVGALIIGEAAVRAAIISPISVIVVALTGIASFVMPSYNMAFGIRLARFVFIGLGALLGLYGVMLGMLVLLIHIISLRSFGVPYFAPFAPFNMVELKDVLIRFPWWAMGNRPGSIPTGNRLRQKFFLKPHSPADKDQ